MSTIEWVLRRGPLENIALLCVVLSSKKRKRFSENDKASKISAWEPQESSLAEDEELAMQLLSGF